MEVKSANHRPGERCIVASAAIPEVIHPDVLSPTLRNAAEDYDPKVAFSTAMWGRKAAAHLTSNVRLADVRYLAPKSV